MARRMTPEEREERRAAIVRMQGEGLSQRAIAERLGVSRALIQKELRAMRAAAEGPRHHAPRVSGSGGRAITVARQDYLSYGPFAMNASLKTVLPPPDHYGRWRSLDLDRDTFSRVDANELVSILINVSPEISRAVWDYLRLLNAGHEIRAWKIGSNREIEDKRAQAVLGEFITQLEEYHGTLKNVAGRLFMAAITRGAFFAELVLDDTARRPVDIATPDPAIVRFRMEEHPERGDYWQPGQWQGGEWVSFDVPTIRYIPVDPEPGVPYGRPLIAPAIFPSVFLLGLMHDLRRVVAQQGYPRTDIVLDIEAIRNTYAKLGMKELQEKIDQLLDEVRRTYAGLEPDDAYVHTSSIQVNRASGAIDASALQGCGELITAIERMAIRALKTMPIMMGGGDSVAETRSNREWEIFGEYVTHLQHYAETLLERLFEVALRVQGIQADVSVKFAAVRSADDLRDEQTLEKKIANAIAARDAGFIDQDEASEHAVGHPATGEEREEASAPPAPTDDVEAEPGEGRSVRAASDEVLPDWGGDVAVIDEARMRQAMDTWEEAFQGEDVETLLDAEIEGEGQDEGDAGDAGRAVGQRPGAGTDARPDTDLEGRGAVAGRDGGGVPGHPVGAGAAREAGEPADPAVPERSDVAGERPLQ